MHKALDFIYQRLYKYFGPQQWWPAETSFEVMLGAILTQNTSWKNVEKAIANLKRKKLLNPFKLYKLPQKKIAVLIRPAGYYNIKAKRIKEFLRYLIVCYNADLARMRSCKTDFLRRDLLNVYGIGPETADSILLYALNKPVFVIDAYTKRILTRHSLVKEKTSYQEMQDLFMKNLKNNTKLFNEYHALLVKLAKEFCLKTKPKCNLCPLK